MSWATAKSLSSDQRGAAMIEYALVAALIALALMGALMGTGTAVRTNLEKVPPALADGPETETRD